MKHRINSPKVSSEPSVVDPTETDIHLSQPPPVTQMRKPSGDPTDSFYFPEIDRRMIRIGGKCFTRDDATERHFERDSEIWKGSKFATPAFSQSAYENPRARANR